MLYSGNESILHGFKNHFETLATAADNPNFDQKYHDMSIYEVSVINDLVFVVRKYRQLPTKKYQFLTEFFLTDVDPNVSQLTSEGAF